MELKICDIKVGANSLREVQNDDSMDDLCASIRRIGMVQPLVVVKRDEEMVLIAGHRRYRAAKIVGLHSVPVVVRQDSSVADTEVAFAENLFRKDLSPVETAGGLKDVLAAGGLPIEELARGVHRSVDWVRRMVAMCDWPSDVLLAVHEGSISVGAGANLALVADESYRGFLVINAVDNGATARTTAAWLQGWRSMMPEETNVMQSVPASGPVHEPMVPQLPCMMCEQVMRMDALSHIPVCVKCAAMLRSGGEPG